MKFTLKKLEYEIAMNTVCPGTERYNKFHQMMMNYVKAMQKEIETQLNDLGSKDPHPISFYSGQREVLREILGEYPKK